MKLGPIAEAPPGLPLEGPTELSPQDEAPPRAPLQESWNYVLHKPYSYIINQS